MEGEVSRIASALVEHLGATHIDGAYDKVLYWLHDDRFPLRLLPPHAGGRTEGSESLTGLVAGTYPDWVA